MSRHLRIAFPGATYHVMARGNNKQNIFLSDADRYRFLQLLTQTSMTYRWRCFAYCLMDNHIHLFIETQKANISESMRHLNGVYAQYFHREHKTVGHLFQGRFLSKLVEKDAYALELIRYILLNPVRARLVQLPSKWKWSSYQATVTSGSSLIEKEWILAQFGTNTVTSLKAFQQFVLEGMVQQSLFSAFRLPEIIGTSHFIAMARSRAHIEKKNPEVTMMDQDQLFPDLAELFVPAILKDKMQRNKNIRKARFVYCYPLQDIADAVHLHYASVSRIANKHRRLFWKC